MENFGNFMQGMGGNAPPRATVQVDLNSMEDITCVECKNSTFEEVIKIKKLSRIVSPSGNDELVFMKVLICHSCGTELQPPGNQ